MNFYLCADQGGSKTHVAVCGEDGSVVGAASGEGSPLYYNDPENFSTRTIRRLAEKILCETKMEWKSLSSACVGALCLNWPCEKPVHEKRLRDGLQIDDVAALNDSLIAMRAGTSAPNACVICAGTGLNIAAQTESGITFVYGCYITMKMMGGLTFGGSAIDAAAEAEAGVRPPTALSDMITKHTGYASFEAMYTDLTTGKFEFAQQHLVPGIYGAALSGDDAALEIINDFVERVTRYAEVMINKTGLSEIETELVFSGGLFKGDGRMISDTITKNLAPVFPRLRFANARLEPVCGAMLIMLERRYGGKIPSDVLKRFNGECKRLGLLREVN